MNDSVKHIRRSEKQIRALLHLQKKNNTSVTAFCKAHKIHKATFYNWCNKYGFKIEKQQEFIPVHFSDHVKDNTLFAEIELAEQVTVKLFQKVDATWFKALLQS